MGRGKESFGVSGTREETEAFGFSGTKEETEAFGFSGTRIETEIAEDTILFLINFLEKYYRLRVQIIETLRENLHGVLREDLT